MTTSLPPLANPERVALLAFAAAVAPPPPVDLNAWAVETVEFHGDSPVKGAYQPDYMPWYREVLEALGPDDPCDLVALLKSIQIGGTVLAQIFLGGKTALDPGPCMMVHPSDGNARRFVLTKWRPFIRANRELRHVLKFKTREVGASVNYQERADGAGFVQHAAATSANDLSQVSIRDLVMDDVDKWVSDGTTGDPVRNAMGRTEAYRRVGTAKVFQIGNPVLKHSSAMWRAWLRGSQERLHLPCPHCQLVHPHIEWEGMQRALEADCMRLRAEGMGEAEAREAAAENAHFPCVGCGEAIRPAHWPAMKRSIVTGEGGWVADNPAARRRVRSFYVWAALVDDWRAIARRWWAAKGNPAEEQSFLNEVAGLPYEAAGEAPPWEAIRDRAQAGHDRGTIPEGGLILVLAIDCQGDRVEWHVMAFGPRLRRWTVDYGVIPGHIREQRCRDGLDALIERQWPNAFGHRRKPERIGIDAGAYKADVETWVRDKDPRRVWMVRGARDQNAPDLVEIQSRKQRREAQRVTGRSAHTIHWVGAAVIKAQLYGCLTLTDPLGPGWCGFPRGLDDEFFRQLTAERRQRKKKALGDEYEWVRPPGQANEVLDTAVYAQALAVSLGWKWNTAQRWEDLRQRWETLAPPAGQGDLFAAPPPAAGDDGAAATSPADTVTLPPARASSPAPAAPSLAARFAALNDEE